MSKLLFSPVSVGTGLLAGLVGKKAFTLIWARIDGQEAPQPASPRAGVGRLAGALAMEGALIRVVRGLADHGSRYAFSRLTGTWPGDKPTPTQ